MRMGTQKLFSPLNYNYELKNREDIYRDKTNSNTVQKYTLLKFKKCSAKFFNFFDWRIGRVVLLLS